MTEGAEVQRFAPIARWAPALLLPVLLLAYHLLFGRFFPNATGAVGHDYSLALTSLLAGTYWFQANGPLAVPWFTPAFCGGQPFFADVQSVYYSLPQLLTLAWNPLTSCYVTMLSFAVLGYAGTYLLLRSRFGVGPAAALLGATAFMFNGFFAHRMIVGHIGFHGFMLVPWLAFWLLARARDGTAATRAFDALLYGCLAGLAAAYCVQSGLGSLLVPVGIAVLAILLLHAVWHDAPSPGVVVRGAIAGATASLVSASKLVAGLSFMSSFPRADYLLPGYRSFLDTVRIAALGVFVSPADIDRRSRSVLTNVEWNIGRHELEYGVTIVPLIVILVAAVAFAVAVVRRRSATRRRWSRGRVAACVAICLLLLLPLALNTYGSGWNALLKRIPLVRSSSSLVRWWLVYVPVVAVLAGLALDRLSATPRRLLGAAGMAAVVALNFAQDRTFYVQDYRPDAVIGAHRACATTGASPPIRAIGVMVGPDGRVIWPQERNDLLTQGLSQLICYNPSFGYGLESFPVKDLHPGSIWDESDGHYNVKNPACYVFPRENHCSPGDHFLVSRREDVERFVRYRPVAFEMSRTQRIANVLTGIGLAASLLIVAAAAIRRMRQAVGVRRRA